MPLPAEADDVSAGAGGRPKKRKTLAHEKLYLDLLPSSDRYSKSFMHRDTVTQVQVTAYVLVRLSKDPISPAKFMRRFSLF